MAGEMNVTVIGNLTSEPELRTLNNGSTVASFTIASNERRFNKQTQQWENGDSVFMRCSAWRNLADNVSQSLHKGMAVIAQGILKQRQYTDKNGGKHTVIEMTVNHIGPDLTHAMAQVQRNQHNNSQQQNQNNSYNNNGFGQQDGFNGGQDPWSQPQTDEPEF